MIFIDYDMIYRKVNKRVEKTYKGHFNRIYNSIYDIEVRNPVIGQTDDSYMPHGDTWSNFQFVEIYRNGRITC